MPPTSIETKIASLSHDGRGIATINSKTSFVAGALPNEVVQCKLTKKHRRYNEADVTAIVQASPDRVTPLCKHFGICGGCSMQHLEMQKQVQFKQEVLLEQLKHFGNVTPETILPPLISRPWGYRRKARLGVRFVRKTGNVLVGFREKSSNILTDIIQCPVLHETIGTRLTDLNELIQSLSQVDQVPQIDVAISDDTTALVFRHLQPFTQEDLQKLQAFGARLNFHIYLQPNSPEAITKIWPEHSNFLLNYALPDYQLTMHFHPLDFMQVNGEMNRLMIQQALALLQLESTDQVLDLFCGLGNFTLPIARFTQSVMGIEGSQDMVNRAHENAALNQITNATFKLANLMAPHPKADWLQPKYDKILLDPPRTGAKEIIPLITQRSVKKIVYVSCNPATLARDARELVYNQRYQLKTVGVMNMFPHTSHIEAIALFEK